MKYLARKLIHERARAGKGGAWRAGLLTRRVEECNDGRVNSSGKLANYIIVMCQYEAMHKDHLHQDNVDHKNNKTQTHKILQQHENSIIYIGRQLIEKLYTRRIMWSCWKLLIIFT